MNIINVKKSLVKAWNKEKAWEKNSPPLDIDKIADRLSIDIVELQFCVRLTVGSLTNSQYKKSGLPYNYKKYIYLWNREVLRQEDFESTQEYFADAVDICRNLFIIFLPQYGFDLIFRVE